MNLTELILPPGSLGLELEAVHTGGADGDHRSVGCRVKGWQETSSVPADIRAALGPGAVIAEVDGVSVEKAAFATIVSRISVSTDRRLRVFPCSPPTGPSPPAAEPADVTVPGVPKTVDEVAADIATISLVEEAGNEVSPDAAEAEPLAVTPKSKIENVMPPNSVDRKKNDRSKDGKLLFLNGRVSSQQVELQRAKSEINHLHEILDNQEAEMSTMKDDIGTLKKTNRNKDGRITLLSFQLDKSRCAAKNIGTALPEARPATTDIRSDADRVIHCGKWVRVMREVSGSSQETELKKNLLVQRRISERLEDQMRQWVEEQIEYHKKTAVDDVEKSLKSETIVSKENLTERTTCGSTPSIGIAEIFQSPPSRLISSFPETVSDPIEPTQQDTQRNKEVPILSPVSESQFLVKARNAIPDRAQKMTSNIRKRDDRKPEVHSSVAQDKENMVNDPSSEDYSNTPIMKKLLHPSKKRAVSGKKDDSKPSIMDTSYEFVDNVRSSRSQSEQSVLSRHSTATDDAEDVNLSVYPLTPAGPGSRNNPFTSPTVLKLSDQMNKLRGQNASIRSDLQKFRGMIQKVKKEVRGRENHE